ncbi:sulfotransferase family 2 domain-containing protein [Chelatococcus sambhunathii]|uniref:Sulfotransferase family 2 domain-containing protein n=1 Tax=Chelatococcus sambhunathii TaxID=363953 RepID=A0ABU1DGP7_9HYPH|nr:hypothetical protein [Chelatococcus sambhunathii]MDR4307292.1 sulfotransferase family 2 domain-containing protein [Chelatococcus sambhunathii]
MIFSVHIPKTAGTSFARALEARFGKRLALYYGVHDPKTTEGLRVPREELAGPAAELEARGFECLHGHYHVRNVQPLITDPAEVWTWLRDPVERTLSQFDFYKERPLELKELAERVKAGEVNIRDFAQIKGVRDLQTRYLKGFDLADYGFVGITEHFELGLSLLFGGEAPTLKRRYNATEARSVVDAEDRQRIAKANVRDLQLYADGLRLFVDRLAAAGAVSAPERPAAASGGLLKRLRSKVA